MAPSTRSAKDPRINFGASKARAAAPAVKTSTSGPADAMTKLFRREFAAMISVPPSAALALESADPRSKQKLSVEVLAMNQQISSDGVQSTLQICAAVDSKGREVGERWVSRSVGFREFFPLVGRVPKRPRQLEDDDEVRDHEVMEDEGEEAARKKRAKKPHPVKRKKTDRTATASSSRRNRDETPKSSRRDRPARDQDQDVDSGDETETEPAYGRGKRNCHGRSAASGSAAASTSRLGTSPLPYDLRPVKSEDVGDELVSLCGAVDDLAVRTTVEPGASPRSPFGHRASALTGCPFAETDVEAGSSGRRDRKGKGKATA